MDKIKIYFVAVEIKGQTKYLKIFFTDKEMAQHKANIMENIYNTEFWVEVKEYTEQELETLSILLERA